ncbi:hypothetical protein PIB30_099079 [Stylosanthes scabra]|uniref:Uncharacterized protein n=1 Tax=Stylosanthes scabra TaxID=79078 RepID=A0ABU6VVG8_9FABA|nr:hypothetical protein [Stylosanthes scabra]
MVRTKQTGKRTRVDPNAPPAPPRLSQMPVESWFEEDDQRTMYQERLSRMEILVPKYLAEDVLPEAEFQEFWRLIDIQGLRQFISLRERYYPRFAAAAYTTEKQINWPYLIAHKMVKYSRGAMRRNLLGPADEGGDDEDDTMEDVPPTFEAGTSSQVPAEAEAPPQLQPDYAELIQQGFDDMRALMSEGFSSLSDRMDRLDLRMTGQSAEIQDLSGEFRSFRDSFQRSGHQEQQDPAPGQD